MKELTVSVVEGGGKGFRQAKVRGKNIGSVIIPVKPIETVEQLLGFIKDGLSDQESAIAVATAGVIENHSRVVVSPNIHFLDGVDLGNLVSQATGKPVYVANDMESSVVGMAELFPEPKYFICMTWSSGIGMRIYKDGRILSDAEGGHVCIDHSPFAPLCGCGLRGCIEAIAGGKSVERRIVSELEARGISLPEPPLSTAFDAAYLRQEPWATDIYRLITVGMGRYLASLQTVLHLPAIIWKGTFALKALRLFGIEKAIRYEMRKHLINFAWESDLKFYFVPEPPELIPDGDSFIGAAKLASDYHFSAP